MTPCRDALQVFSASLRKPAQRYGYRGLKIFTSLSLRFQDFQRRKIKSN
ncbi:Transposase OrfAB, subunit B [Methylomonas albis]|nr:Transposase OrfAB, subunit B [Methylomonas albis]